MIMTTTMTTEVVMLTSTMGVATTMAAVTMVMLVITVTITVVPMLHHFLQGLEHVALFVLQLP